MKPSNAPAIIVAAIHPAASTQWIFPLSFFGLVGSIRRGWMSGGGGGNGNSVGDCGVGFLFSSCGVVSSVFNPNNCATSLSLKAIHL